MENNTYHIVKNKKTKQYHIYTNQTINNSTLVDYLKSRMNYKMICNPENTEHSIQLYFNEIDAFLTLNEKQTREKCADLGRVICGTCISHLYGNFNNK